MELRRETITGHRWRAILLPKLGYYQRRNPARPHWSFQSHQQLRKITGSAPLGSADRGAGRVAEDGDDAALADPPAVVVTPGQHVIEVGHQVDAHVVGRCRRVDREVDPGGAGA